MPERAKIEPVVRLPNGSFFDLREIAVICRAQPFTLTTVILKGQERLRFILEDADADVLNKAMSDYHFGIEFKKERN